MYFRDGCNTCTISLVLNVFLKLVIGPYGYEDLVFNMCVNLKYVLGKNNVSIMCPCYIFLDPPLTVPVI
jgi:hypothetical protein